MAYRNVSLMFLHAFREAPIGNLTSSTMAAGFPASRVRDDQKNLLARFSAAAANQHFTVDRGAAATGDDRVDRLIVPSGHNLSGATVEVRSSATGTFPGTLEHSFTAGAGIIDETFSDVSQQHLRLEIVTSGQWELGEIIFTRTRSLVRGVNPRFQNFPRPNFAETITEAGLIYRAVNGPEQRRMVLSWQVLDPATDLDVINDLSANSLAGVLPLWLESPDDADPLFHMRIEEAIKRVQDSPNPQGTGLTETVTLEMLEDLA